MLYYLISTPKYDLAQENLYFAKGCNSCYLYNIYGKVVVKILKSGDFCKVQGFSYHVTFSSYLWEGLNLIKYCWPRTHFEAELPQFYFMIVILVKVHYVICDSLHNSLTPYHDWLSFSILIFNQKLIWITFMMNFYFLKLKMDYIHSISLLVKHPGYNFVMLET